MLLVALLEIMGEMVKKNKSILIRNLICALLINTLLFYTFINSKDTLTRIIQIPFIFCGIAALGKVIFLLKKNQKYIELFNLVYVISFFLYVFGFLGFWCYFNFINADYVLVVFSLPFWIVAIKFMNQFLSKRKKNKKIK